MKGHQAKRVHNPADPWGRGTAKPSKSTNSNPGSHTECRLVRAPTQGGQSEEQADTPRKRKKTGNKQTAQTGKKKGGEAEDRHIAAKPRTNSKKGGQTPSQATPKATPTGPPERTAEDRPAKLGDTQPRAAAHRRKGHPGRGVTHPTGEVTGRRKKNGRSPNKRERGDGDQETQDRDRQRTTPQSHHKAGLKTTHPPCTRKKKQNWRGGGRIPPTKISAHPHATGSPTRRWRETDAAHARSHTPQRPSQKKAECRQNPNPQTRSANPSPKKKTKGEGGDKPQPAKPPHTPPPQATPPEGGEKRTRRTQGATRPNSQARKKRSAGKTQTHTHAARTPARKGGAQPKPTSRHTHPRPWPGLARLPPYPTPNARTSKPSQKWRGKAHTRAQAHAP